MSLRCLARIVVALVLASAPAFADTFTETFEGGSNTGGWAFGGPMEVIETTGGNPGAYLHSPAIDTFAPQPRTTSVVDLVFTGDYRTRNVTAIGIDLITIAVDFSAAGRPLTLMLLSDEGTPADPSDDWAAYFMGPADVPEPGDGWASFSFAVPSQATSLPPGWQTIALGPSSPPAPDWNDLIIDVDELRFFYGNPEDFFIFQVWNVGLDNVSVVADLVPVELLGLTVE
jgi:hypothetical protein